MRDTSIPVPQPVLDGIRAVQQSGQSNMLDRAAVERIADALGFHAAVLWLHDHPSEYARGVFHGFRAEPSVGDGTEHEPDAEIDCDDERAPDDHPAPGAPDA